MGSCAAHKLLTLERGSFRNLIHLSDLIIWLANPEGKPDRQMHGQAAFVPDLGRCAVAAEWLVALVIAECTAMVQKFLSNGPDIRPVTTGAFDSTPLLCF